MSPSSPSPARRRYCRQPIASSPQFLQPLDPGVADAAEAAGVHQRLQVRHGRHEAVGEGGHVPAAGGGGGAVDRYGLRPDPWPGVSRRERGDRLPGPPSINSLCWWFGGGDDPRRRRPGSGEEVAVIGCGSFRSPTPPAAAAEQLLVDIAQGGDRPPPGCGTGRGSVRPRRHPRGRPGRPVRVPPLRSRRRRRRPSSRPSGGLSSVSRGSTSWRRRGRSPASTSSAKGMTGPPARPVWSMAACSAEPE